MSYNSVEKDKFCTYVPEYLLFFVQMELNF